MAKSKNRPAYKLKKKQKNIQKQKQKQMENQKQPRTWVYNKDKDSVEVPIKAWQTLNKAAEELSSIAVFVTTMELVGQQHMTDGTLLPVFDEDLTTVAGPDGKQRMEIKPEFWNKHSKKMEAPTIVMADGKTIYDANASKADADVEKVDAVS